MFQRILAGLLGLALLSTTSVLAQDQGPGQRPQRRGAQRVERKVEQPKPQTDQAKPAQRIPDLDQVFQRFDTNGDGQLSREEAGALREAMRQRLGAGANQAPRAQKQRGQAQARGQKDQATPRQQAERRRGVEARPEARRRAAMRGRAQGQGQPGAQLRGRARQDVAPQARMRGQAQARRDAFRARGRHGAAGDQAPLRERIQRFQQAQRQQQQQRQHQQQRGQLGQRGFGRDRANAGPQTTRPFQQRLQQHQPRGQQPRGQAPTIRERLRERFDQNGNGKLDGQELERAKTALQRLDRDR